MFQYAITYRSDAGAHISANPSNSVFRFKNGEGLVCWAQNKIFLLFVARFCFALLLAATLVDDDTSVMADNDNYSAMAVKSITPLLWIS